MVQMDVHAREDELLKLMLDIGELSGEIANVVIVHEGDGSNCFLIFIPLLTDQIVSDEIPQGLRPVRIFLPRDVAIEIIKKVVIKGDAEADEFLHSVTNC